MTARPPDAYRRLCDSFRWQVPARFNIGAAMTDTHAAATPNVVALWAEQADGNLRGYTYEELRLWSNRVANALAGLGLRRGDTVGVLLGQSVQTAVVHTAISKAGMIALPLFTAFGEEAIAYRLEHAEARALFTSREWLPKALGAEARAPDFGPIVTVDGAAEGLPNIDDLTARASDRFTAVDTAADDPAFIIYTSGTTGQPKGALHAHRSLIGHEPGIRFLHPGIGPSNILWSPQDWAWIAGLVNVLLSGLHLGIPILALHQRKFDPEKTWDALERHRITRPIVPPPALRLMRDLPVPQGGWPHRIRTFATGGETIDAALHDWARGAFGTPLHEVFGQTECNLVLATNSHVMDVRPGQVGRPVPGHRVALLDDDNRQLPWGSTGRLAIRGGDPVMLLRYWKNPDATAAKYADGWLLTGDIAATSADGHFRFVGRDDEVIKTSGYRVGPSEIEDCLGKHPAVRLAAAIGVPDPQRGQAIKAFVTLREGHTGSDALAAELQDFVRRNLAVHLFPRAVEFLDALPTTITGKVRRKDLRDREAAKAGA